MKQAAVIGGGPAGLMAAQELARAGALVTVFEAKPTVARKFLMAGKSGLNLAKNETFDQQLPHYFEASAALAPMLAGFDAQAVMRWAEGLGQAVFTGSTQRVFPVAMKGSPLLRAWLRYLHQLGVTIKTNERWQGWQGTALAFGSGSVAPDVTVLALGGASWSRLGSDGAWVKTLGETGSALAPFQPTNAGLCRAWSAHMAPHLGAALKGVRLSAGDLSTRGEAVLSQSGLEGGGIYMLSRALRTGAPLRIDLLPDLDVTQIQNRLENVARKASTKVALRKALRLDPVKIAIAQECAHPLPRSARDLARALKALELDHQGLAPLDQAISVAGGVQFEALNDDLMLRNRPGVFCAGEMLDWEAPTGGYLITGCLATGRWAGRGAARYLGLEPAD